MKRRLALSGAALLVLAVVLAPVWLAPVLATNDGPSHLYNAALAHGVRTGQPPFATYFHLEGGVRPNVMSQGMLATLGPIVGWDAAERVVVTLAMIATFVLAMALLGRRSVGAWLLWPLVTPLAGWLATNWFIWGGAYDFALSIPLFCGLLLVLDHPPPLGRARHLALQALLGLLYLTHVFTFAVGIALVLGVIGWQAIVGSGARRGLLVALPALAVLVIEMASGGQGTGAVFWGDLWTGLRDLATGDFVVSAGKLDLAAGIPIVVAVAVVAAVRWREARRDGRRAFSGADLFGLALFVASVLAPQGVGPGTYIPIRMRCLAVVALLPAIAQVVGRRPAWGAAGAAVLFAALGMHSGALLRQERRWSQNLALIDHLLTAAGAQEGSWVATRFTTYRFGHYNVVGIRHAIDRVALHRRMVILDNYEALYGVFSTTWRGIPDWAEFRQATGALTVRLVPGTIRWPVGVFVLHESDRRLRVVDPRLALGPSAVGGPFAVTLVVRQADDAPR